jgi:hypothetical protein
LKAAFGRPFFWLGWNRERGRRHRIVTPLDLICDTGPIAPNGQAGSP